MDLYYFAAYRARLGDNARALIRHLGTEALQDISARALREIMSLIANTTAGQMNEQLPPDSVRAIFGKLGYIHPTDGLMIGRVPTYAFKAIDDSMYECWVIAHRKRLRDSEDREETQGRLRKEMLDTAALNTFQKKKKTRHKDVGD